MLAQVQPWQPIRMRSVECGTRSDASNGKRRFIPHSAFRTLHFRKAGRYKLAAPVPKTGSALPRSERYPPTPPFHCGENEIQASLISSASVGATPTPATNLGRCSGCRSVKPVSQTTVGSDDWSITSTSHHFGSVAQLAEQPVVCGKAEGANPFGSAIFQRVA